MVRLDLERIGIPYETEEGVADFHAAGRHSYVTGLLLNGVSLVHAKELARHSDVKMTMKYTHVGLGDQAESLNALPAPSNLNDETVSVSVSKSSVGALQTKASSDTDCQAKKT